MHRRRRDRLRALVGAELGECHLVVTDLANIRYLSGFSGSNAVLVVAPEPEGDLIGTDGRYVDQVAMQTPDVPAVIDRATLGMVLAHLGPGRCAVEDAMPIGDFRTVRGAVGEPLVAPPLIASLRAVKDAGELDVLARACAITAGAFEALADEMRVGATELSLARRLEQLFGEMGAEDRAFDTIVGSGPNSAIPHHEPGLRRLEEGDLVVVDAGARVDGYHADMTRTFVVARHPEAWQADVHATVAAAQAAGTAAYRVGAVLRDVDHAARHVVEEAGLADRFTHGLGHGVGLEIHEAPMVGARATGTLGADMAVTVEPGVYLPGRGGVRIEDTLVVADAGPRILTEAPRGLRVVG